MIFSPTRLEDAFLIDVERQGDERGFLARTFCEREFAERGLPMRIVQSSTIYSPRRHTLRGLNFQEAADVAEMPCEDIGLPGRYPYTRGPYPTMYRGRSWTMRQIAARHPNF